MVFGTAVSASHMIPHIECNLYVTRFLQPSLMTWKALGIIVSVISVLPATWIVLEMDRTMNQRHQPRHYVHPVNNLPQVPSSHPSAFSVKKYRLNDLTEKLSGPNCSHLGGTKRMLGSKSNQRQKNWVYLDYIAWWKVLTFSLLRPSTISHVLSPSVRLSLTTSLGSTELKNWSTRRC